MRPSSFVGNSATLNPRKSGLSRTLSNYSLALRNSRFTFHVSHSKLSVHNLRPTFPILKSCWKVPLLGSLGYINFHVSNLFSFSLGHLNRVIGSFCEWPLHCMSSAILEISNQSSFQICTNVKKPGNRLLLSSGDICLCTTAISVLFNLVSINWPQGHNDTLLQPQGYRTLGLLVTAMTVAYCERFSSVNGYPTNPPINLITKESG